MLGRALSFCLLALLLGCGKPAAPNPPVAPPAAAPDAAALPNPPPAAPAVAPEAAPGEGAELTELLSQLTQVVRRAAAEQQRVPKSLDELVSSGYLNRVPQAPPGKAFTITKQLQVELISR